MALVDRASLPGMQVQLLQQRSGFLIRCTVPFLLQVVAGTVATLAAAAVRSTCSGDSDAHSPNRERCNNS